MTSTCTNSTRESNSSHTCVPLSKMPISLAHGIIRSSVLLVFLTASFVGNIVLALVLQRKPQLLQVANRFIFNLLVTDLLQISLVAPWVVATSVPLFWPLNSHFCTALVSLTHLFAFASVNTIVVVSVDRYLSIIHPLSYPAKMTPRRGYMLLYGTWIVAILQSTPPLYGWGQAAFDQRNALCSMIWGASPSYTILSVVSFIILPLVVMIACYSVVFGAARRQHALLYNVRSHSLEVRAKDRVENEDEEGERRAASRRQDGGEAKAEEGGVPAEEESAEASAGRVAAAGSEEVRDGGSVASEGSSEGRDGGPQPAGSVKADKGRVEVSQCNVDLGEDDAEFGEDDLNFSEEDVEAVNIPESPPPSRRNSTGDPPLPRCYQCKAAKVIFLIVFSYVLSLGPYCFLAVLAVWVDVQTKVPQWVITIIIWLFFLQCCMHPYIYGYMHKTIKKEIQDMLKKFFCKEKPPKEDSHPDLPGTEAGTEGGTEGKTVPSHDSVALP
ncbi:probable G-protein coupled receptor 101 [Prionailurus viverrinus]|uniref:probable G-protein coupled receptor 101 n=1 Tax=Prionailurus bengalensis TaxID=37029 RepID=UPI001CA8B6B3|nr:probable G-protein coupled receptor 101 [Prionailurus bengalensis]XP_047699093.1 probable G-protein coupled receptor 101 [Prionailurus viverrinus]